MKGCKKRMECVTVLLRRDGCAEREMYEQSGIFFRFYLQNSWKKKPRNKTWRIWIFFRVCHLFLTQSLLFMQISFHWKMLQRNIQACFICHCSPGWKNSQNSCLLFRIFGSSMQIARHLESSDKIRYISGHFCKHKMQLVMLACRLHCLFTVY